MTSFKMEENPEDLELFHYGIKGMKWGVRREVDTSTGLVKKTARQERAEARYIKKGYSLEVAEKKARGRIKVENVLLAAGGVAAAGLAIYTGKTFVEKRFSEIDLPVGSIMTNINAMGVNQNLDRRTYVTVNQKDANKYRGLLAKQLQNNAKKLPGRGLGDVIYETKLHAAERIKAPSHNQARKLYKEFQKSIPELKNVPYKNFNHDLVDEGRVNNKKFFEFMKSKGYNAVLDSNDQFMSGYNAKKPLILFNAKSSTIDLGKKVLFEEEIQKNFTKEVVKLNARAMAYSPSTILGLTAVVGGRALSNKSKEGAVRKYFAEHPDSKLTPAEAYAALDKDASGRYHVSNTKRQINNTRRRKRYERNA